MKNIYVGGIRMKKYKVGYTQGVFDMFHIGHLNLINNAKMYCEILIVGVNSDRLVQEYKSKIPVINELERRQIIGELKSVNKAVIVDTLDKEEILREISFDAVFIGDDWKDSERWQETKKKLALRGVDVIFLPHTPNISSTMLKVNKEDAILE